MNLLKYKKLLIPFFSFLLILFLLKPVKISGSEDYLDLDWYFEIFQWLSEKCQELSGVKDQKGFPTKTLESCLDPERVIQTVINACEKEEIPTCDACAGVFVRGRYGGGDGEFACQPDGVCHICTGFQPPTPCAAFCMHTKEYEWGSDEATKPTDPASFTKREIEEWGYGPLFSHFGFEIPTEGCTCTRSMFTVYSVNFGGQYSSGYCRDCVPAGRNGFSACKKADWCEKNCPQVDRCPVGDDICSLIGIPPGEECVEKAKKKQCQNLFSEIGESIPSSCEDNPLTTLEEKCRELKKSGKKEVPRACKILPLFTGKIEMPEEKTYEVGGGSFSSRKLFNSPLSILGCPPSLPVVPEICLPSIEIPDIRLPEIKISVFGFTLFQVKLPNIITEDLNFPCIKLCDINECQNIFPPFDFQVPFLSLPTIEIPPIPLGEIDGLSLPYLEIEPIRFPRIPFPSFYPLSLGNVFEAELVTPNIPLPKPRIKLGIKDIDLSPIFGYILKIFLNDMLGIPDKSFCREIKTPLPLPFRYIYPDRYLSWSKYIPISKIPEIPYCEDINAFCARLKSDLAEIFAKVKEIENKFNSYVQSEIQSKLDQAALEIQKELTEVIKKKVEAERDKIREKIREEIRKQIEQGKREIVTRIDPIEIPEIDLDKILFENENEKLKLQKKYRIPWPEGIKRLNLKLPGSSNSPCKNDGDCTKKKDICYKENKCYIIKEVCYEDGKCGFPLVYQIPPIPLSKLSYEKEKPIKGPGLQAVDVSVDLNITSCTRGLPIGGNPCPKNEFENNLGKIRSLKAELERASQEIISVLE